MRSIRLMRAFLALALLWPLSVQGAVKDAWSPAETVEAVQSLAVAEKSESVKLAQYSAFPPGAFNPVAAQGSGTQTYVGPGDVVSGATAWGSVARAYSSAQANTTNNLADLVAVTGGAAVCTLRTAATGKADLSAYCPGSLTPSAACAAASGGSCLITKIYDQTGSGNHWTQATLASMPAIVFNAVNGLPAVVCSGSQTINTTATFTATNFSMSVVYERTSGTATGGAFGGNGNSYIGSGSVANNAGIASPTLVNVSGATDLQFNGLNATFSSTANSEALNVNGTDNTGLGAGTSGLSTNTLRFCRAGTVELLGDIAEGGIWPTTAFTSTQRGNLYTNMHGSNGYNGAF